MIKEDSVEMDVREGGSWMEVRRIFTILIKTLKEVSESAWFESELQAK